MSSSLFGAESGAAANARAAIVNRTHRVVRERAMALQTRKRNVRQLVVPCLICSAFLLLIATAVWTLADEGVVSWEDSLWKRILELGGDAGSTISILLVWFLPLSVITAATVLLRRTRSAGQGDEVRR